MKINVELDRKKDPKKYDRLWRKEYNIRTANVKRKLADYRYMDKKAGFPITCDYNYEELLYILSISKCIYCGSTKNLGLDRIDNKKGHTKDNTVAACYECNTLRSDKYTAEEMRMVTPLLYKIRSIELEIKKIIDRKRKN